MSFAASDIYYLGWSRETYLLLALRCAVSSTCLFLAYYLGTRPALKRKPWLYSLAPLAVAVGICLIVPLRPQTLPTQLTAVAVALMAFYLFIPNLLSGILATSLALSLGFILAAWYWAGLALMSVLSFSLLLILANVVGYGTALRLARLQREQFKLLDEERRAKERLIREVHRSETLAAQLRAMAETDDLTGLSNRRHLLEVAKAALHVSQAEHRPFSLCMLDLDSFKQINDTRGHDNGDRVLRVVAEACAEALRPSDFIGRFGGEEFIVAFPDTDLESARKIAERLRQRIADIRLDGELAGIRLTVSAGVAEVAAGEESLEPALKRADEALYSGKRSGRNRVVVQDPEAPPAGGEAILLEETDSQPSGRARW